MNMLKHLTRIILAAVTGVWISGCANYDSDIDKINERLDGIESNRIKTIEQQIEGINASLPELEKADQNLKGLIEALQGKAGELGKDIEKNARRIDEANSLIAELQKKDSELENKIADLKTYVDGGIKDARDWASATFATLEQYNGIVEQVAGLGKRLDGITDLDKKLDKAIEEVKASAAEIEKSLKGWVNERLTAYWTIEETKAELEAQKDSLERRMKAQRDSLVAMISGSSGSTGNIESLKAGLEETDKAVKDNAESISTLRSDLEKAKSDIKTAYEKAIKEAIEGDEGILNAKIADEIKTVNGRIDSAVKDVNDRLESLGKRVSALEENLKTLKDRFERRIQSLTHIPTYSDGIERSDVVAFGGELRKYDDLALRFKVKPLSAAGSITKEQVSAEAAYTLTRASAGDIEALAVKSVTTDAQTGILTVVIDPAALYQSSSQSGLSTNVSVTVTDPSGLYDISTEYVEVKFINDPGLLTYRTNNKQEMAFPTLKAYDRENKEIELFNEFADGVGSVYTLSEATAMELKATSLPNDNESLTYIRINKPVKIISQGGHNFENLKRLTAAELNLLDTSDETYLGYMFYGCENLASLDLTGWDTRNLTSLDGMFFYCKSLASLNLAGWNTQNVTSMLCLFFGCESLTALDISGWDMRNVTNMSRMFFGCESLTSLYLSSWNTGNVTSMDEMFYGCKKLKTLEIEKWDVRNVTSMRNMFIQCDNLTTINLSGWDTQNLTYLMSMFCACANLQWIDLSDWDTRKVASMRNMFGGCKNLTSLDLSGWIIQDTTDIESLFYGCESLETITMEDCDDNTVRKIEEALTAAGIRDNVKIKM